MALNHMLPRWAKTKQVSGTCPRPSSNPAWPPGAAEEAEWTALCVSTHLCLHQALFYFHKALASLHANFVLSFKFVPNTFTHLPSEVCSNSC